MHASFRSIAWALAAVSVSAATPDAEARPAGWRGGSYATHGSGGWHQGARPWGPSGHRWVRGGRGWNGTALVIGAGVGLGLGLGFGTYYAPGYWVPGGVIALPAPVVQMPPSAPVVLERAPPPAPEPVIYPNLQQTAAQTEADRQECNRWAMTQPGAVAEASVFHRATLACMEGRGYTVR